MRLLIASSNRSVVGGAEFYVRSVIPALMARGHEIALLHELEAEPERPTVDPPGLPRMSVTELGVRAALDRVAAWKPDLVYQHGLVSTDLDEALLERHRCAMFVHNYHGTCVSGIKRFAFPRVQACTRTLGPGCLACYFPRRCGGRSAITMLRNFAQQKRRLELVKRQVHLVVASEAMRREYLRHGLEPSRVTKIPYFPADHSRDTEPPALRPFTNRVLFLGRLTAVKGARTLVEALPEASLALGRALALDVAGAGPEREAIERLGRRLGVPVVLHGFVRPDRRLALLRGADVLGVPSLWPEPFATVGIEAGCVGLPAVAFALGGIPEWLETGVTGELAPGDPPTARGLAHALASALRDPARYGELRRGAWRMSARFSLESHVGALEPVLERAAVPS